MSDGASTPDRNPRIAIDALIMRPPMSGVERAVHSLACALPHVAPDCDFVVYYPRCLPRPEQVRTRNVAFQRPFWPNSPRILRILWQQALLPRRLRRDRIDLLHAPAYTAPLLARPPYVLTVYDVIALKFPQSCKRANVWHYRAVLPRSVRRAARLIVPSRCTADDLHELLGVPKEKIRVIPLGVSGAFRRVDDPLRLAEFRRRWGLPDRYVLYLGNLEPKKNLHRLLEAFAQGRHSGRITHRLVLAGAKAWHTAAWRRALRDQRLGDAVTILRRLPDKELPLLYSGASVFVFPSLYEGFGLPPLEAMACGVPVITSSGGALPEVVGDAALVLPECDPRQLRIAIEKVLANSFLRERLRTRGLARARRFTWERTAQATAEVYREVLRERCRAA